TTGVGWRSIHRWRAVERCSPVALFSGIQMRRWTADWLPPEKLSSFGPAKPKVVLPAWRCFRRMGGEQDQLRLTDRIPAQIAAAASRLRSVRASDANDRESGQAPESKWFARRRRVPDLTTETMQCFADH